MATRSRKKKKAPPSPPPTPAMRDRIVEIRRVKATGYPAPDHYVRAALAGGTGCSGCLDAME